MYAAEAAVAHDEQNVAGVYVCDDVCDDVVYAGAEVAGGACCGDVGAEAGFVESVFGGDAFVVFNGGENGEVCGGEGFCEFFLEEVADGGVAAGVEEDPEAAFGEALAQALYGLFDGGGVVGEVVYHGDAVDGAADFLATCHALEGGEGGADLVGGEAGEACGAGGHGGVADVEVADHGDAVGLAVEGEVAAVGTVGDVGDAQVGMFAHADGDDFDHAELCGGVFADVCAVGAVCVDVDDAVFGNDAQQAFEGEFNFFHIGVDVCVVHLDVVDDDDLGQVVEEFGAFVEEGGVVFVALKYAVVGVCKVAAAAEVACDAADHEARVEAVVLHEPGEHGGGGGFAVGACDNVVLFAPEEELFHGLGEAHVAVVFLKHGFNLCIAAAHGVADDDEVCAVGDVVRFVALGDGDALTFEECGHGGVDVGICAGYHVAFASHGRGNGAHGCAADSEKVDMFHK